MAKDNKIIIATQQIAAENKKKTITVEYDWCFQQQTQNQIKKIIEKKEPKEIIIYDITYQPQQPQNKNTYISDHINKTGENYLIGNNKKMVFTDLTRLYTNQEKMITTCLGTKYEKNKKQHTLPSTDIGLIAILCRSIQPKTIIRGILINIS